MIAGGEGFPRACALSKGRAGKTRGPGLPISNSGDQTEGQTRLPVEPHGEALMGLRAAAGGAELGSDTGGQAGLVGPGGGRTPTPSAGVDSLAGLTGWVGLGTHGTGSVQGRLPTKLSPELKPEAGLGVGAVDRMGRVREKGRLVQGWQVLPEAGRAGLQDEVMSQRAQSLSPDTEQILPEALSGQALNVVLNISFDRLFTNPVKRCWALTWPMRTGLKAARDFRASS